MSTSRRALFPLLSAAAALVLLLVWRAGRDAAPSELGPAQGRPAVEGDAAELFVPGPEGRAPEAPSVPLEAPARESLSAGAALGAPPDDPVQCLVYGRVTDAAGRPLSSDERVGVGFVDALGVRLSARADDCGAYSIAGLAPGSWWLSCGSIFYRSTKVRLVLDLARPVVRQDFALEAADVLRVKVTTPDGEPLWESLRAVDPPLYPELVPVATRAAPGEYFFEVRGSLNNPFGVGQFWQSGFGTDRLPPEYIGVVVLAEGPPVVVSLVNYHAVLATQRVEAGATEVAFTLTAEDVRARLATVRMRVVDAGTDEPLAGVRPTLAGGAMVASGRGLESGGDGTLVLEHQAPGKHELSLMAQGYELFRREVLAAAGAVTDLGTIALEREVEISGRVVDEAGAGVAATVGYRRLDREESSETSSWAANVKNDAEGAFRIGRLGRGEYLLQVGARDEVRASAAVLVDTRAGPVEGLRLVALPAATLVLVPPSAGWRELRFSIEDGAGRRVVHSRFYDEAPRAIRLAPGEYTLFLVSTDAGSGLGKRLVLGAEPQRVDLGP